MRGAAAAVVSSVLVASCAAPPPASAPPPTVLVAAPVPTASTPVRPPTPEETGELLLERLTAVTETYLQGRNVAPLSELWAADLAVRAARSREASKADHRFGKARLLGIYRWAIAHDSPMATTTAWSHVTPDAGGVTIEWIRREADVSAFGERIRFEQRDGRWLIVRFEYWPLLPVTLEEFGDAYWTGADEKADAARARGDDRQLAYELMAAYRFDESAAAARRATDARPTDAWAWGMRSIASSMVGDVDDAERAMQRKVRLERGEPPP